MKSDLVASERSSIVADLGNADDEIRRLAVERLLTLPVDEATPCMIAGLGDESWRVRKAAVGRLVASSQHPGVVQAMIVALSDGDNPGRRNSAVEALVQSGPAVIGKLVDALDVGDVDVRKLLIDTLAGIGDGQAREALTEALADSDINVRGAAADALGVIGGDSVAELLRARATDDREDPLVRLSALRALARLEAALDPDDLGTVLDDPMLRPAGFALLGHSDHPQAVEMLRKGLASRSRLSGYAAIDALLHIASRRDGCDYAVLIEGIRETALACDSLVEDVIERLPEVGLSQRLVLVQFLGIVGEESCVAPILEAGCDEAIGEVAHGILAGLGETTEAALVEAWPRLDAELRRHACRLLGRTCGGQGMALLVNALDYPDSALRAEAARALGERGAGEALPKLVCRLEAATVDDDFEAKDEQGALVDALVALATRGQDSREIAEEAVELLAARLDGANETARLAITSVLGRIGRVEDVALVASLLKDPSAAVRRCAVEALDRLDPGAASEPLRLALADESALVRMAAATTIGQSDHDEVLDDLVRLAHDEDERVRAATLRAVGRHCEVRSDAATRDRAMALIRTLLDDECLVALAAIDALAKLGGREAALVVAPLLERPEPEVLQAAIVCIGAHGDTEVVSELLALVAHPDWSVRSEAISTLAERRVAQAVPPILRSLETEQDSFVRETILRALKQLEE